MPIDPKTTSSYLQNLPAIFSEELFLSRFLLAFERVLTGLPGVTGHERIRRRPGKTVEARRPLRSIRDEEDFLSWLASWVALSLRADWTPEQKREFLSRIVPLYRRRGTKENVAELLGISALEAR